MKLNYTDKLFISEYIRNGGNGTQAYLAIKPDVSVNSAAVSANRMLKRPAVQEALDREVEKTIASREGLIREAHRIKEKAEKTDKLQVALNAIDLKGKLAGRYREQSDGTDQFERIIQMFQVNVNVDNDTGKAIDVTPEIEDTAE